MNQRTYHSGDLEIRLIRLDSQTTLASFPGTAVNDFSFGSGEIDETAAHKAFALAAQQSDPAREECHSRCLWDEGEWSHGMHPYIEAAS